MSHLSAKVREVKTNVKHQVTTESGVVPCEAATMLTIVAENGSYFLFRLDAEGHCIADTWHLSQEEAIEQAQFEYGVAHDDWVIVSDDKSG